MRSSRDGFFFVQLHHSLFHLFLKLLNTHDGVLGRVLAGKHVHEIGHVESITLNLGHHRRGSVLELLDILSVLVNEFLVVVDESHDRALVEGKVHVDVLDVHVVITDLLLLFLALLNQLLNHTLQFLDLFSVGSDAFLVSIEQNSLVSKGYHFAEILTFQLVGRVFRSLAQRGQLLFAR